MKNYNYNYIISNSINDKQYIGSHTTDNLSDGYLGSGVMLNIDKKIYGKENFKLEILTFALTIQDARTNEPGLIEKYNTLEPNGYNISKNGGIISSNDYNYYLNLSDNMVEYLVSKLYELYSDYGMINYRKYLRNKQKILNKDYRTIKQLKESYVKTLNLVYNRHIYF
jgi:hypothetical protein